MVGFTVFLLFGSLRHVNRDSVRLVALRSISNGAKKGELPSRLKVLDWGQNNTLKGTFTVDEKTLAVFDANQRSIGRDRVALDYEHNTVPGSEEFKRTSEPRPVAAYWTPKIVPGEGVFLEAPAWTPSGEQNALNYEDISAAPFIDGDRVIGLHSVALTKAGASEFTFFNAPELKALIETLSANQPKTNSMLTLAALAALLSMAESSTEDQVKARLTKLSALGEALEIKDGKIVGLGAPGAIIVLSAEVDGKTVTMQPGDVVRELMALRADRAASAGKEVDALIATFSAEGKVPVKEDGTAYTADELKKLDVTTLKLLSANTPATVPLTPRAASPRSGGASVSVATFNAAVSEYRVKHNVDFETAFAAVRQKQGV